jgi:FMN phosphatase YigB (HAD superfamily)
VFEKNKPEFLSQIQVSVYVDDYPDMVEGSRDLGINAFLLNRPYNMNADINPEFRINSLWDIKCV